jgi:hypothetical protein
MYDNGGLRLAGMMLPEVDDAAVFGRAVTRVRKLLSDCLPGMSADAGRLRQALAVPQADGVAEAERQRALGWLAWLEGDWAAAEALLAGGGCEPPVDAPQQGAHAPRSPLLEPAWVPYWLTRVRLLQGHSAALAEYEAALKRLGGSPRATAWYVDLLWRGGRCDRAEQVWKAVRANKRVAGCDEGPLIEARLTLRKGEYAAGERLLREAAPGSGVVQVERQLLLAWAQVSQRKGEPALEALRRAAEGPYPAAALAHWRAVIEARLRGEPIPGAAAAPGWRDYLKGQEARAAGRSDEAISHYRAAVAVPAVQPFATHALASLGETDRKGSPPGLFFAVREHALQAAERFRLRQAQPGQFLEALDQAARAGVEVSAFEGYRRLARQLQEHAVTVDDQAAPPARRNSMRLALETISRVDAAQRQALLTAWARDADADDLRLALGRHLLRLALQQRDPSLLGPARPLLPADAAAAADVLLSGATAQDVDSTAVTLWRAASEPTSEKLQTGSYEGVYRAIRQAILLVDAARRADVQAVAALLEDLDAWRPFRPGPPRFALAALEALAAARPTHAGWARVLPRWLTLWEPKTLGTSAAVFAGVAGAATGAAPAGVDAQAWFLYQASASLRRDDAPTAAAHLRRASDAHPLLLRLERRARMALLARALGYEQPGLLADFVDLLSAHPAGPALLDGPGAVEDRLAELQERADLPGRLWHHLAVIETRLARRHEADDPLLSTLHARRAWGAWRGAYFSSADAPPAESRELLVDHLLAWHRARVHDHLSRGELGPARSHWQVVMGLPDLPGRAERFRDELATEYLLKTREAMRFGDIPEGFRADYERAFSLLASALALDPDNVRLLTAHVEICVEWFFDLYQLQDARLFSEVERLLEPAERLAGLARSQEGLPAARAALSDYWKFRGFAAASPAAKADLYREALRLNPGNDNVRHLLARLEGDHAD